MPVMRNVTLLIYIKPGPKPSGKAKSAAERMREYRARTVPVCRGVLEAAMVGAGRVDALAFQVDGMDRHVT